MAAIQLVPAEFVGFVMETLLYGVFLVLHMLCFYVLVVQPCWGTRPRGRPVSKVLVGASGILFVTISAKWVLSVIRAYHALVTHGGVPSGALMVYGWVADPLDVAGSGALYSFEVAVADVIMLYRLWIVWGRNRAVCTFPALLFIAFLVMGTGITVQFSKVTEGQDIFHTATGRWVTTGLVLTLTTNLYCSTMISYRIWSTYSPVSQSHGQTSTLIYVIVVIVESTVLYTLFSLITLIAYLSKSNLHSISRSATSPIIGIALTFSLVIVRAGLGLGKNHMSTIHLDAHAGPRGNNVTQVSAIPLAVHIRRECETSRMEDTDTGLGAGDVISISEKSQAVV